MNPEFIKIYKRRYSDLAKEFHEIKELLHNQINYTSNYDQTIHEINCSLAVPNGNLKIIIEDKLIKLLFYSIRNNIFKSFVEKQLNEYYDLSLMI